MRGQSLGVVIQFQCQRCGHLNEYKRKVVPVEMLNETREQLEIARQLLGAVDFYSCDLALPASHPLILYAEKLRKSLNTSEGRRRVTAE
jgi:hypothetical protein